MATNRMSGNLLGVEIKGNFISCETSCEFNFEADLRGASPVDAGRWKEWIPGVRSWNINVNAGMLLRMSGTSVNTILNAFLTGERIPVRFATKRTDLPSFSISGNVYVQNGNIGGAVNSLASWNTVLMGDGPFTIQVNDNIVFAISANEDNTELLGDGLGNLIVGENDQ